jgi:hypothetical protein
MVMIKFDSRSSQIPYFFVLMIFLLNTVSAQNGAIFPGADENTPSQSEYFSWINNTNEGTTEEQTLINLAFFEWLQNEYGMRLDIYAFDAGAIDGSRFYGSIYSDRFKNQFPTGFDPIYLKAKSMGIRLGVWGGPDGFGDTAEEAKNRIDMMVKLCRDYQFALFKMDAVCGQLREGKIDYFVEMMNKCREYSPDLILLNHRLKLGKGQPHATTSLLGGAETYIDVHMVNRITAPHHRAQAISRRNPRNLTRLTEDHGVCLSSCLDYWEDELILQAFGRCLILAPQIYANPWFLRDDEYPKLARIYNLHRKYRDILVTGKTLPENDYGPKAIARGDKRTRFITLRNLTWDPVKYTVKLDTTIGLENRQTVQLRQFHPTEKIIGSYPFGSKVEIEVYPFRSCLLMATTQTMENLGVVGCDYNIVQNIEHKPVVIRLLGLPGSTCEIKLAKINRNFNKAMINGKDVSEILQGKSVPIDFPGKKLMQPYHRKIGEMQISQVPEDALAYYEATCFAADNNALEIRSLLRSGATSIPQVQRARDAFFTQNMFVERELWDRYAFDGKKNTAFSVSMRGGDRRIAGGAIRLDFGEIIQLDKLVIKTFDEYSLQPWKTDEAQIAEVSVDLKSWKSIRFLCKMNMAIDLSKSGPVRYVKIPRSILRISEIEGFRASEPVNRSKWRASNLFARSRNFRPQKVWSLEFRLGEITKGSYLAIAINGKHGIEGVTAALRIKDKYVGAPDRAPSFQSNTWEYPVRQTDQNYTFYIPLTQEMTGQNIEAKVFALDKDQLNFQPEVWITAYPIPFETKQLVLHP